MKKLLLTLSAPILALSPVVAVVACGKESTVDKDTQAIKDLQNHLKAETLPATDLAAIVDDAAWKAEANADAKTAVINAIKKQIEDGANTGITVDADKKHWGTDAATANTFDGVAFEFNHDSTNAQAITIAVKGTKNKKSVTAKVVITGTAAGTVDAEQQAANAVKAQFDAFTAPLEADRKEISVIDAKISATKVAFTSAIATDLGLVGAWPTIASGSSVEYTLTKVTSRAKQTYTLSIFGKSGSKYSSAKVITLTSSDDITTPPTNNDQDDIDAAKDGLDAALTAPIALTKDFADLPVSADIASDTFTDFATEFGIDTEDWGTTLDAIVSDVTIAFSYSAEDGATGATLTVTITISKGNATAKTSSLTLTTADLT